jgi:hypothetical protein
MSGTTNLEKVLTSRLSRRGKDLTTIDFGTVYTNQSYEVSISVVLAQKRVPVNAAEVTVFFPRAPNKRDRVFVIKPKQSLSKISKVINQRIRASSPGTVKIAVVCEDHMVSFKNVRGGFYLVWTEMFLRMCPGCVALPTKTPVLMAIQTDERHGILSCAVLRYESQTFPVMVDKFSYHVGQDMVFTEDYAIPADEDVRTSILISRQEALERVQSKATRDANNADHLNDPFARSDAVIDIQSVVDIAGDSGIYDRLKDTGIQLEFGNDSDSRDSSIFDASPRFPSEDVVLDDHRDNEHTNGIISLAYAEDDLDDEEVNVEL